jgi:hypothetical protein
MEAGLALRAGQQSAALKEAHAKVAALEQSLQQVGVGVGGLEDDCGGVLRAAASAMASH